MSKISSSQIDHLAHLAKLPLSEEQKKQFAQQLSDVLVYVEQIGNVKTKHVGVTETITGLTNVLRQDDKTRECLDVKEVLKNAFAVKDDYFKIKAIFDND